MVYQRWDTVGGDWKRNAVQLQYAQDLRRAELSAECIHVAIMCPPLRIPHTNKTRTVRIIES